MSDFDIREGSKSAPVDPRNVEKPLVRPGERGRLTGIDGAVSWGLASLLIGCTVLLAGCTTMVFAVLLFRAGPSGLPTALCFAAGLIGSLAIFVLALASLVFGALGWQSAHAHGSSPALGVAGVAASAVGLVTWLIAAITLIVLLASFL
jgi:hypothetical protein